MNISYEANSQIKAMKKGRAFLDTQGSYTWVVVVADRDRDDVGTFVEGAT